MNERRKLRIGQQIKEVVSEFVLYELQDPRLGFITVTAVDVSDDLSEAVVKISVLGEDKDERLTLQGLRQASGRIQQAVGKALQIRTVPHVRFEIDQSIKRNIEISRLINKAIDEDRQRQAERAQHDGGGEEEESSAGDGEKEQD